MRVREDICALGEIYARSGRFMLVREDLCAPAGVYARARGLPSFQNPNSRCLQLHLAGLYT